MVVADDKAGRATGHRVNALPGQPDQVLVVLHRPGPFQHQLVQLLYPRPAVDHRPAVAMLVLPAGGVGRSIQRPLDEGLVR